MSEPLLRARGLSKSFRTGSRTVAVLRQLDLDIGRGETVAVVGESGVGKSTLLHLLGGLDRPDEGKLFFGDFEVYSGNTRQIVEYRNRNVGFVFQFHHLLPEFTALENVEIPFRIRRDRGDFRRRAREMLARLDLAHRLDHRPGELSGGEQQRVAIARALVLQPPLVLADEPTGNLDPQTGRRLFALLEELQREREFSLVLASHNERLAAGCRRVLRLVDGRVRPLGETERREYFEGPRA